MSSGIGMFDSFLSLYLSDGAIIATGILLICSVLIFVKSKGKKAIRIPCSIIIAHSIIYLALIAYASYLISSKGRP